MTEHVLTLTTDQLYEVYSAAWREFVALHKQATANPWGMSDSVLGRVRHSRTAIGQVCDIIEGLHPDWMRDEELYSTARAQAKIEAEQGVQVKAMYYSGSVSPDLLASTILAVKALHDRDFATLAPAELELFKSFRAEGRKFGLHVGLRLQEESRDSAATIWAELDGLPLLEQQDAIYRREHALIDVRELA